MVSRINNPTYCALNLPLNGHTHDVSGNNRSVTPTDLNYSTNQFGKGCGSFNGSSSYISCPNVFSSATKGSIDFWFNLNSDMANYHTLFEVVQTLSGENQVIIGMNSDLQVYFYVRDSTTQSMITSVVGIRDELDHHIHAHFEDNNCFMYVDGILAGSDTSCILPNLGTSPIMTFGASLLGQDFASAKIFNCRAYADVTLTNDEMRGIFTMGATNQTQLIQPKRTLPDISDTSLKGAWLNTETEGTADDYSSNGEDGTNTGVILGRDGGEFDGGNNYIELPNKLLDGLTEFTVSVWTNMSQENGNMVIYQEREDANNHVSIYYKSTSNEIQFAVGNGSTYDTVKYSWDATTHYGEWIKWDFTYNAGIINIYKNGVNVVENEALAFTTFTTGTGAFKLIGSWVKTPGHTWNGTLRDMCIYSESKNQAWVTSEFNKSAPDSTLKLYILNGDMDISRNRTSLTLTDCIIGDGLELSNGGIAWSSITFTSHSYWYKAAAGSWNHYLTDGTNVYTNGVLTGSMPVSISATGFSSVTGDMKDIKLFSEIKSADYALADYNRTRKYY